VKRIVLIGPPGAGKGTQAGIISEMNQIPAISTGQILRDEVRLGSELGQSIKSIIDAGSLVPDELMLELISKRIAEKDCENGYILDGYPRTPNQAEALIRLGIQPQIVLYLKIADELIIERLSGRRVHESSGRTYHVLYNPPKVEEKDDITGDLLVQRADDKPENIKTRLFNYHASTQPVINFYQEQSLENKVRFVELDASLPIEDVTECLKNVFTH
jgi:adenylate kinase